MAVATGSPVLGRRRLARDLRRLRVEASRTITEAAEHLECSPAKVSRIETGAVGVNVQDVRALADFYGVDPTERDALIALVRQSRQRGWWHVFADVLPPDSATLYGLEEAAASIHQHAPSLIPGLLQTPAYARALIGSLDAPVSTIERRIDLRMRRQSLIAGVNAPRIHVVLDEAVLHRVIGGRQVMTEQLNRLLEVTQNPQITIQVTPFESSTHPAAGVGFTVFDFDIPDVVPVVYLEQLSRNTFIDDVEETRVYLETWTAALGAAEDPELSRNRIADCIHSLKRQSAIKSPRFSSE